MADDRTYATVVDGEMVSIKTNPDSNIILIKVTSEKKIRFCFQMEENENEVAVVFLDD